MLNKVSAEGLKVPYFTRGTEKRALTLGALASVHEHPFDVLLSARNLSQHLPERSKLSRPIIFGARGADRQSHETNIVVDEAIPKEAASQKRGASEKTIMANPYVKKPKASSKKTTKT
jgi:hypothetical protein